MSDRHEIWELLDGIQMDLRAATAKMVALRSFASNLDLPAPSEVTCPIPTCGLRCKGPRTLAEHLHQMHDGPLPEHWEALDSQVADVPPDVTPDDAAARAHARPSPAGGVSPDAALTSEGT